MCVPTFQRNLLPPPSDRSFLSTHMYHVTRRHNPKNGYILPFFMYYFDKFLMPKRWFWWQNLKEIKLTGHFSKFPPDLIVHLRKDERELRRKISTVTFSVSFPVINMFLCQMVSHLFLLSLWFQVSAILCYYVASSGKFLTDVSGQPTVPLSKDLLFTLQKVNRYFQRYEYVSWTRRKEELECL